MVNISYIRYQVCITEITSGKAQQIRLTDSNSEVPVKRIETYLTTYVLGHAELSSI
jgi:hypothetical protein